MFPTHAVQINGDSWGDTGSLEPGADDDIAPRLGRMDGKRFFAMLLWKMPPGKGLEDVDPWEGSTEYIQCAGSAERMTVEVRRIAGGKAEQYVIGRPPTGGNSASEETIHWDGHDTTVHANEVFTADEAAKLFLSYYRTGWVPSSGYVLRLLDLERQ